MNIQISNSWLKEFIETKATPEQISECLSLCSQSVERVIKDEDDFIYDIEITTNRPDCLSVYGIARELAAVLPRFGITAKLKEIPVVKTTSKSQGLPLEIKITKSDLCPRFTGLVFDQVTIKSSPAFVQKRLSQSGIRSLNNVIDISNYLMLELGQPMHTFDYDKILKNKIILREAKNNEEVITLDGQERKLQEGIMVIEDGEKRIIDLCGIMGAKNSETDENTKRVFLFIQTYNPAKIRRACQMLAFRTDAASRFEKGVDPEGVMLAMQRATLLFKQWCGAKPASLLFDIYPQPEKRKKVSASKNKIDQIIGIDFNINEAKNILESLGFKSKTSGLEIECLVPHWRNGDVNIPEDLVEEIARIYGYHNLPNLLPPLTSLDYQRSLVFEWEDKIKNALKYWGFTEVMTYSLVGKNLVSPESKPLKISNPLTLDLLYLRTSLIPSLLETAIQNPLEKEIKIFEMANVYLPEGREKLPTEIMSLSLLWGNDNYLKLKGILETLLKELGIEDWEIKSKSNDLFYKSGQILVKNKPIGLIGEAKTKDSLLEINLTELLKNANQNKKFVPLPKYPPIIEDFSFIFPAQTPVNPVIKEIKIIDKMIKSVDLIDSYNQTKTFRISFQSEENNLTDREVSLVREKIISALKDKLSIKIKTV